jgi:hypothetical protein
VRVVVGIEVGVHDDVVEVPVVELADDDRGDDREARHERVRVGVVRPRHAPQINSALGISVGPPEVTNNDPVTVCTYKKSDGIGQVLVRFETGLDEAGWTTSKAGFTQHGEAIQDLPGLGDKAFTSTIGSGQFVTNTVVTQKGTTNLLITASGASLAQIETLARQVLASL